jgi:hypothetical protein
MLLKEIFNEFAERYPILKEPVLRSFFTPQFGPSHMEGKDMSAHLAGMCVATDAAKLDIFHSSISPNSDIALIIKHVIEKKPVEIADYILAHDYKKIERLNLKLEGMKSRNEIDLVDWQRIVSRGEPYLLANRKVEAIGYFHPSKKELSKHGPAAADELLRLKIPMSPMVIKLIGVHEHIFSFTKDTKLEAYHLGFLAKYKMTPEELDLFMTVSYLDASASLKANGPDMSYFMEFARLYMESIPHSFPEYELTHD